MIITGFGRFIVGMLCLIILAIIIEQVFSVNVFSILVSWVDLAKHLIGLFM